MAVADLMVTVSGVLALRQGQLTMPLLPAGPVWSSAASASSVAVQSANTVVHFCLAAVCLLAVTPATSTGAGRRARGAIWMSVGTATVCWGFAVPALVRAAGFNFTGTLLKGGPVALHDALAVTLGPLAGSHATSMAGWLLFATCLAGALGALTDGTGLARSALGSAKITRAKTTGARLSVAAGASPGAASRPSPPGALPIGASTMAAAVSGLRRRGHRPAWPRAWLLIALGGFSHAGPSP